MKSLRLHVKYGFTLIELLAVMAIILILASLLVPAFRFVQRNAGRTQCASNLRQLAATHTLYVSDHRGAFIDYNVSLLFFNYLAPYHENIEYTRLCPSAPIANPGGARLGSSRYAYRWFPEGKEIWGSYGINGFCYGIQNADNGGTGTGGSVNPKNESNWGHYIYDEMWFKSFGNVSNPDNAPLMLDAMWPDGWPVHQSYDTVRSPVNIETPSQATGWYIERFLLNRHGRRVNACFLDGSARTVPLNEMWKLKWNRLFQYKPVHPAPELAPE